MGKIPNDIMERVKEKYSAIYYLDREEMTYQKVSANPQIANYVGESGTLAELYNLLFFIKQGERQNSHGEYHIFNDEGIFRKDNYGGYVTLALDGIDAQYDYRILGLSDREGVLFLIKNDMQKEHREYEKIKMETIQEEFLFSMIVDLKEDSCKNSNTTEISSENQNYLDISYSQWRQMIANMFLPDDRNMFLTISSPEYVIAHLKKEKQYKYEIQMMNMDGKFIWVRLNFKRMKGFSDEYPAFVYTVQDIHQEMSQLLQQENIIAAVQERNQQLSDINRAQNLFISNMSHEIRTPINAVLGLDEMILRESDDEQILAYAQDIKSAGKMLLSVINDILDYSKIEAGRMEIVCGEYSIATLVSELFHMIDVKAKEKNLSFVVHMNEKMPEMLYGDEVRIKQIITNLLSNAVKYTEKGEVTLEIDYQELPDKEMNLVVTVKDTGIGMREDEREKLFSEYVRLEEYRNRKVEGTGLGMSIVVRLLRQMGSELQIESTYGTGSVFSFVLPQGIMDAAPVGKLEDMTRRQQGSKIEECYVYAPKAKILVVDDNEVNLFVISELLKRCGAEVVCVESGRECIEKLQQDAYHLVLLDHFMPEMDGIKTLQQIRQLGETAKTVPIIALTANVTSGAREEYIHIGFTDFLEKPVVVSSLEHILETYLPKEMIEKKMS